MRHRWIERLVVVPSPDDVRAWDDDVLRADCMEWDGWINPDRDLRSAAPARNRS